MIKTYGDRQPGLGTSAIVGALTLAKTGTTARTATFPDAAITVAGLEVAQTFTANQTLSTSTNGIIQYLVRNTDAAGTSAQANIQVSNGASPTSDLLIGAYGASRSGTQFGTNRANAAFIYSTASSITALVIGHTAASAPVIIGSNNAAICTFATTGITAAQAVTVPNGTAAAPGIRLTSEASGLYRVSSTSLGFAVAGTAQAALTTAGDLSSVTYTARPATGQDGLRIQGRATGTNSYNLLLTTVAALSANTTVYIPTVDGATALATTSTPVAGHIPFSAGTNYAATLSTDLNFDVGTQTLRVGTISGSINTVILATAGSGGSGTARIRLGTSVREWELKAGASPYALSIDYVGTDAPLANVLSFTKAGIASFINDIVLATATTASTTAGTIQRETNQDKLYAYANGIGGWLDKCIFSQYASVTRSGIVTDQSLASATARGTRTLPANFFKQGKVLKFRLCGRYTTDAAAGNATIQIKLGTTVFRTSGSFALDNSVTNLPWELEGEIICLTTGASGTVEGISLWKHMITGATGNYDAEALAGTTSVTLDTTASQTFDVVWTADDAGTAITCTCFRLWEVC